MFWHFMFFNRSHSNECEVKSHSSDLHFSWLVMLNIFSWFYRPFEYLWRNVCSSSLPIFELSFLLLSFRNFLFILDMNPVSYMWFANINSHSVGGLFTLWVVSLNIHIFKIFLKSRLSIHSFVNYAWCHIQEIIAKSSVMKFLFCVFY